MTHAFSKPISYLMTYRRMQTTHSQRDVAFLLGYTHGAQVLRWEKGERMPTLAHALKLSYITKTPVEELFRGHFAAAKDQVDLQEEQLKRLKAHKQGKSELPLHT